MPAPEGDCWLCGKFGKLTKEHIPPEKAFNDCPLLLMKINEQNREVEWVHRTSYQRGLCFRSLCERCNNKYGSIYGEAYVNLVRRIAERIVDVPYFHYISITGVKRPLAILKQVMLQFVTANGAAFVRANEWVAPFIRDRTKTEIPRDVNIYLFASNMRSGRNSGISGHVDLVGRKINVVSEFTFWPLGTVMSFGGELSDKRLTPIHDWARYPFNYNGSVDLHLCVNPIASEYPVDFRTPAEINRQATQDVDIKTPSADDSREMMEKAIRVSGDADGWVYSGHPNTVNKLRD